jgi:hypothetical protein
VTQVLDNETLSNLSVESASAMFSLKLQPCQDVDPSLIATIDRHVVMLRLNGIPGIFLSVACDHDAGSRIAGVIFEVDPKSADDSMIDDSLRELANIFAGQVKGLVAPNHEIGLPRVHRDVAAFNSHDWHGVSLKVGDGEERLDVALAC